MSCTTEHRGIAPRPQVHHGQTTKHQKQYNGNNFDQGKPELEFTKVFYVTEINPDQCYSDQKHIAPDRDKWKPAI